MTYETPRSDIAAVTRITQTSPTDVTQHAPIKSVLTPKDVLPSVAVDAAGSTAGRLQSRDVIGFAPN